MGRFSRNRMDRLAQTIEAAWERRSELSPTSATADVRDAVMHAIAELDAGRLRVAEKVDGQWITHAWLKKAVLLSFRLLENHVIRSSPDAARSPQFYDKVPTKFEDYTEGDFAAGGFRIVSPAVARRRAVIAAQAILVSFVVPIASRF